MNNTIARFGRKVFALISGAVLMAGAVAASNGTQVSVTLPHSVTVGSTTLPSGDYTITTIDMAGEDIFVIRAENGSAVATLQAQKVILATRAEKSGVSLSKDGDTWSIDKLVVEGDGVEYHFSK